MDARALLTDIMWDPMSLKHADKGLKIGTIKGFDTFADNINLHEKVAGYFESFRKQVRLTPKKTHRSIFYSNVVVVRVNFQQYVIDARDAALASEL